MAYAQFNHPHLFPPNPYPQPPPPPIAHKIWILDCKSCSIFLTNRAMKAVLLLRPNVSLFSSDALPINCSAYAANPDALRCRSPCRPTSSNVPPRTCECLTQTLCCHGCGNTIGYMIVIPCTRCTSSISATNRATNGHRFVFHSSEVVGTERHYILDEPGVIPYEPTGVAVGSSSVSLDPPLSASTREFHGSLHYPYGRNSSPNPEPMPTPPLEQANPLATVATSTLSDSSASPYFSYSRPFDSRSSSRRAPPSAATPHPTSSPLPNPDSSPPLLVNVAYPNTASGTLPDQKDLPTSRALKPGDVLFWHHLKRCGEIPGVEDDKRARSKAGARGAEDACPNAHGHNVERAGKNLGRVVFGR